MCLPYMTFLQFQIIKILQNLHCRKRSLGMTRRCHRAPTCQWMLLYICANLAGPLVTQLRARGQQQQQIFQLNLDTKPAGSEVDEVGLLALGRPGSRPSEGRQARRQGGGLRPPKVGHLLLLFTYKPRNHFGAFASLLSFISKRAACAFFNL